MDKTHIIKAAKLSAVAMREKYGEAFPEIVMYTAAGGRGLRCVRTWQTDAGKWHTQRYQFRAGNWQTAAARIDGDSLADAEENHWQAVEDARLEAALEQGRTMAHRNAVATYVYREPSGNYDLRFAINSVRHKSGEKLIAAFNAFGDALPLPK